ncbi:TPA: cell division ATP-binding protein FtsE [Candidatus Uhrbacteria bacterium]|nr:cell division ATP-binding protein FtsE [Candidatus Uhrbacteria bacterium]
MDSVGENWGRIVHGATPLLCYTSGIDCSKWLKKIKGMIKLHNVSKSYDSNVHALHGVNLHIEPGEFVSIVGQSGTGKTTLLRLLIAEERPSKGKIVIGGWDISTIKSAQVPFLRRQIGVVYQDFKLLPKKTAAENIAFALEVAGDARRRVREVVPQVMRIVGLEGKERRYPHQMSGGEQQRVAIARALVHRPKVLVADEPTGNLDTITAHEIIDLLRKINNFGTTVVLVTHDKTIVNHLKGRVITLKDGTVVRDHVGNYTLA